MAVNPRLYEELAKALARPSHLYRAIEAGAEIPTKAIEGYDIGAAFGDRNRVRGLKKQTLAEALGNQPLEEGLMNMTGEGGEVQNTNIDNLINLQRASRQFVNQTSLGNPKPPKPTNPLDDELKQERLNQMRKGKGSEASVNNAYQLYTAARKGLESSLNKTTTGPILGRLPALTANQQAADSSVAAMAPVLKQLFRVAGEGTFSDRDQEMLLKMVTDRTIQPAARKEVLANIDNIVRAKLGMASGDGGTMQGSPETTSDPLGLFK